jgi:hypothetical protein
MNKTKADLKAEAIKQIAENNALYQEVVADLISDGITGKTWAIHEMMRRIAYTNSSFEHLAE